MGSITVKPLGQGLSFGTRVSGVTHEALRDEGVRKQLNDLFQDHPVAAVPRADQENMPGVIDMRCEPNSAGVVEIDSKRLSQWLPWHFDHCYNNELNRA